MISIIISSKNPEHLHRCTQNIHKTIGTPHEILTTPNADGTLPLAKVYNDGATKAQHDTLLYLHEDTEFKTNNWGTTLLTLLADKNVGAVGVAGTTYLANTGRWYSAGQPFTKGRIIHPSPRNDGRDIIALYSNDTGTFTVVALDGVLIATRKNIVTQTPFDEKTFDHFHLYDLDFTLRVAQHHTVLVTTDILIKHHSHGRYDQTWETYKERFLNKHRRLLPYTNQTKKPDWNNIITPKARYVATPKL